MPKSSIEIRTPNVRSLCNVASVTSLSCKTALSRMEALSRYLKRAD